MLPPLQAMSLSLMMRRPVVAAMTVVKASPPASATSSSASLNEPSSYNGQHATASSSSPATPVPTGKSKWAIDESEELLSNSEHRLWTLGPMALMGGSLCQAALQAQGLGASGWVGLGAAVLVAYVLSDLGTGIYHWSVDNYGDGTTPIVGKQIAAFQVSNIIMVLHQTRIGAEVQPYWPPHFRFVSPKLG